jgi:hypothetical protein
VDKGGTKFLLSKFPKDAFFSGCFIRSAFLVFVPLPEKPEAECGGREGKADAKSLDADELRFRAVHDCGSIPHRLLRHQGLRAHETGTASEQDGEPFENACQAKAG